MQTCSSNWSPEDYFWQNSLSLSTRSGLSQSKMWTITETLLWSLPRLWHWWWCHYCQHLHGLMQNSQPIPQRSNSRLWLSGHYCDESIKLRVTNIKFRYLKILYFILSRFSCSPGLNCWQPRNFHYTAKCLNLFLHPTCCTRFKHFVLKDG